MWEHWLEVEVEGTESGIQEAAPPPPGTHWNKFQKCAIEFGTACPWIEKAASVAERSSQGKEVRGGPDEWSEANWTPNDKIRSTQSTLLGCPNDSYWAIRIPILIKLVRKDLYELQNKPYGFVLKIVTKFYMHIIFVKFIWHTSTNVTLYLSFIGTILPHRGTNRFENSGSKEI